MADAAGAILERLNKLYPKGIDLSLDRVWRLMAELGNPQDRLPPVIHVAGTNGKGSTVAYLRAIFEAAGYTAHVYTSPHLVRFNERIRVAGKLIEDDALAPLLAEVESVNAGRPVTFFEVTTAAAFLAYSRIPADVVLLETGLGGRLDATNVVRRPAACALTPISIDHVDFLGGTLEKIATEKAGIIKPGVPVAIGPQPAEASAVFAARAAELGAKLYRFGAEWMVTPTENGMLYEGQVEVELPRPGLPGRHQYDNAGLAVAVIENLAGFNFTQDHVSAGLAGVEWPARLQRLTKGPLVDLVPEGVELLLDGGHNESAGVALADWAQSEHRPLSLVFGMRSTKAPEKFFAHVAPYVAHLRAVTIEGDALTVPTDRLVEAARANGVAEAAPAGSIAEAVAELARVTPPGGRILICGSLYLAGHVLEQNS